MKIDLIITADDIKKEQLSDKTAVVFDILRATSTIVTALANGCREVVPVVTVEEAVTFSHSRQDIILGGERESLLIPGFHYGNSPLEYEPEKVKNRTVVITTTNGTRAIRRTAEGAGQVLIGSLLNARAVAEEVIKLRKDVVLVCAGTRGKFSLEDTVAAGMVTLELTELTGGTGVCFESDLAVASCQLAMFYREDPLKALYDSLHGQKLATMGLSEDLAWCARRNHFDIVPVHREGRIMSNKVLLPSLIRAKKF